MTMTEFPLSAIELFNLQKSFQEGVSKILSSPVYTEQQNKDIDEIHDYFRRNYGIIVDKYLLFKLWGIFSQLQIQSWVTADLHNIIVFGDWVISGGEMNLFTLNLKNTKAKGNIRYEKNNGSI